MEKIMPLELLASIKGAASSKDVEALFEIIRKAVSEGKLAEETGGSGSGESGSRESGSRESGSRESGSRESGSAGTHEAGGTGGTLIQPEALREDTVVDASDEEKDLIRKNFPGEKNGYLVVPKVIDD